MIYDDFSLRKFNKEIQEDAIATINHFGGDDDWEDDILLYPEIDSAIRNQIIRETEDIYPLAYA